MFGLEVVLVYFSGIYIKNMFLTFKNIIYILKKLYILKTSPYLRAIHVLKPINIHSSSQVGFFFDVIRFKVLFSHSSSYSRVLFLEHMTLMIIEENSIFYVYFKYCLLI